MSKTYLFKEGTAQVFNTVDVPEMLEQGWTDEPSKKPEKKKTSNGDKPSMDMTKKELVAEAKVRGIEPEGDANKQTIIDLIEGHDAKKDKE